MINEYNLHKKPIVRSRYRARLGMFIYGLRRHARWMIQRSRFAKNHSVPLNHVHFSHRTPLLRQLKDVDMQQQYNKISNLRIAAKQIDGIVIHPGEIFSYWNLIGNPTIRKGYLEGMVLHAKQHALGFSTDDSGWG